MQVVMSVGKAFFNINDTIAENAERDPEPDDRSNQPVAIPTVGKLRPQANKTMSKAYVNLLDTYLDTCSHTPTLTPANSKISRSSKSITH